MTSQLRIQNITPTVTPGTEELHILDGFICPISGSLMTDPVIVEDGHSYERSSIVQWIESHKGKSVPSPMTGLPLGSCTVIPNHNLRRSIQDLIRRIPTLLLSPKIGNGTPIRQTPVASTRLVVGSAPQEPPRSIQSRLGELVPGGLAGGIYALSTSLGFFGTGSGLIGVAVETPSFIEGTRKSTASPKGSSTNSRWIDFVLLLATPLATNLIIPQLRRTHLFSFQATGIATSVSGPSFGFVLRNPLEWSRTRKITSLSVTDVLMDNLEGLVDDSGYYIDGSGWFRQPSGEVQQTGWFPGKLNQHDIVSLYLRVDGQFEVDVNGRLVASAQADLPKGETTPAYVWGFISLNGTVKSVLLLERL